MTNARVADRCNGSSIGLRFELDVPALRLAAAALSEESVVELHVQVEGELKKEARACWPRATPVSGRRLQAATRRLQGVAELQGVTEGAPRRVAFRSRRFAQRRGDGRPRAVGPRQCSLPLVTEARLSQDEQTQLMRLHKQCPAYFAPPRPGGRAVLDRMHRRRPVADLCGGQKLHVQQG